MKRYNQRTRLALFVLMCMPFVVALFMRDSAAAPAEPIRRFTVKDSVEMADFTIGPMYSPDGSAFAVVTQRGNLTSGKTEASLWIGSTSDVAARLRSGSAIGQPILRLAAQLSATINGGGDDAGRVISRLYWSTDSHTIFFLGRGDQENRRLYKVATTSGMAVALTPDNVDMIDCTEDKGDVLCVSGPGLEPGRTYATADDVNPDAVIGTGHALEDLLFPNARAARRDSPTECGLWWIRDDLAKPVIDVHSGQPVRLLDSYYAGGLAISPDHRRAVLVAHALAIPAAWETYTVPAGLNGVRFHTDPGGTSLDDDAQTRARRDYTRARQYFSVDLSTGNVGPLVDAPVADFMRGLEGGYTISWSPAGTEVAVSATYLPLGGESGGLRPCVLAIVTPASGAVRCLSQADGNEIPAVTRLNWNQLSTRLTAEWEGQPAVEFSNSKGAWIRRRTHGLAQSASSELSVEQDLNHPPVLMARDAKSRRQLLVLDPNPQLGAITLGEVTRYTWKLPDGAVAVGGLAKPPDYVLGRRYPLVIQTHGFPEAQFFRVGYESETANAGRALAARGMMVLQVSEPHSGADATWKEPAERGLRVYLAAIDQLAAEGLVDPARVGVTGYSRRGIFVLTSIENAPDRFAAAAVSNAEPGSLFGYNWFVDGRSPDDVHALAELMAGARPYGAGLQQWIDRAPGLRTDLIKAPVLVTAGDPPELLALWNLYAPLRDQGKPVELQYFRGGQHNLTKPLEIFAHQELLVDWFDYWLTGYADPDPRKAAQYARWRAMKRPWTNGSGSVTPKQ